MGHGRFEECDQPRGAAGGLLQAEVAELKADIAELKASIGGVARRAPTGVTISYPGSRSATVEATAWLREDLLAMIESLDGMVDDVRRRPGGSGVVLER